MKDKIIESLGVKYRVTNAPETTDEFDTLAKRPGACLDEAVNNVVYRSCNPDFRAQFEELVMKETGMKPNVRTIKEEDGSESEERIESERKFFNRVLSSTGKSINDFQPLADTIVIPFDPSATPKGPKKLPVIYRDAARQVIEAGAAAAVADKLSKLIGRPVEHNEEALGWAIKEMKDIENRRIAAELLK